ncbi:MAG: hypothetical protein AAF985_08810, partial [Bacteroidota bacterium]
SSIEPPHPTFYSTIPVLLNKDAFTAISRKAQKNYWFSCTQRSKEYTFHSPITGKIHWVFSLFLCCTPPTLMNAL